MTTELTPDLIERFVAVVGEKYALRNPEDIAPFMLDHRDRYFNSAQLVLRPGNVDEISQILKLATETGVAIVPQGGGTGLVGAGIPLTGDTNSIVVSTGRLNKILDVDAASNVMLVEAGVILQNIQEAADEADRLFPLSLGAQGTCQIGGNIGSNAGGTAVLAYGNTRELIMGLEVVLPTGEVMNGLSRLRKDNTGYDLRNLFIGAEGTLGIVTKAVLKLFPKPKGRAVAFVGMKTPKNTLNLLNEAKNGAGNNLTGFEFMSKRAMTFTLKNAEARQPMSDIHEWTVLMEISSEQSNEEANATMEAILSDALEAGIIDDATIAASSTQQDAFWKLREDMSWAQKPEGASVKNDISVPVGSVPDFIKEVDAAVLAILPDARIVNFGHLGDGNLHYNLTQPVGWTAEDFFAYESQIHDAVNDLVIKFDGSISAEHGIGQLKRGKLAKVKDPVALALMNRIKAELDPAGIMNPGKVL